MAELDTNVSTETETGTEQTETNQETTEATGAADKDAEIARLKADLAKQKAATDKATKEAGDYKKQLRSKQTAEETAAEEAKAQQEALMQELETLRKERAVANTTAKILPIVSNDSAAAAQIAEYLYGAEDVDAALAAIQKAWTAKEKALRLEFGKIPAPGVGGSDGPTVTKAQLDSMSYMERVTFATEHPEEYRKLMGRKSP